MRIHSTVYCLFILASTRVLFDQAIFIFIFDWKLLPSLELTQPHTPRLLHCEPCPVLAKAAEHSKLPRSLGAWTSK
jgi:hypothetical protein